MVYDISKSSQLSCLYNDDDPHTLPCWNAKRKLFTLKLISTTSSLINNWCDWKMKNIDFICMVCLNYLFILRTCIYVEWFAISSRIKNAKILLEFYYCWLYKDYLGKWWSSLKNIVNLSDKIYFNFRLYFESPRNVTYKRGKGNKSCC